jgi:5-formyltetrahydrofolate cyclo-ligase
MPSDQNIRKSIRTQRKNLSPHQVDEASKIISEKIIHHPAFINAKKIAYYFPNENEVDPTLIISHARELKKELFLPVLSSENELHFYFINSNTEFKKNKFNIEEPVIDNQNSISPEKLDLILIPIVAFDVHNNRLGRGLGCYDRALKSLKNKHFETKPTLVGLAYEFQRINNITSKSHDISMDYIFTESDIYFSI